MSSSVTDAVTAFLILAVLAALWIPPVVLGVRWARRKGISPHWMWFGVHPLSGWIAFWIVRYKIQPRVERVARLRFVRRRECPSCGANEAVLQRNRGTLFSGLFVLLLAGPAFDLFERTGRMSQVYRYSGRMTNDMFIYLACGIVFVIAGVALLWLHFRVPPKFVRCLKCEKLNPAAPASAAPAPSGSCTECRKPLLSERQFVQQCSAAGVVVIGSDMYGGASDANRISIYRQLENHKGFACKGCGKRRCMSCLLSLASSHPNGGKACPSCGGAFERMPEPIII